MTPFELLQLSGGYWSICTLHAGVKLEVFTHLQDGMTAIELAKKIGADARGMSMLLNALAAMELLGKEGDSYSVTPFSAEYLSKNSAGYLGHIIMHHHHLVAGWNHLAETVKFGGPEQEKSTFTDEETWRESFLLGMFNLASLAAPRLVPQIDLAGRKRLLDLGGGPGTYAIHFCKHNPGLEAIIYDLPTTRPFAERTVAQFGLSDRIGFTAGDIITDEIGGAFDVVWISHLLHSEGPEGAALIVKKAAKAMIPGGLMLVQEFILDDNRDAPLFPALFSLNMLIGTPTGQAYSQSDLAAILSEAGLRDIKRLPLELPNGAGIMAGCA